MPSLALDENVNQAELCGLSLETSPSRTTTSSNSLIDILRQGFFLFLDQSQMAFRDIPQFSKMETGKATLWRPPLIHSGTLGRETCGHQQAYDLCEGGSLCKAR